MSIVSTFYRWSDGASAQVIVSPLGVDDIVFFTISLVEPRPMHRDFMIVGGNQIVLPCKYGVEDRNPEPLPQEMKNKARGLFIDLGVARPRLGKKKSLVLSEANSSTFSVTVPRWVEESRWEQRHAEAEKNVLVDSGSKTAGGSIIWRLEGGHSDPYLGYVERLEIRSIAFNATRGHLSWSANWNGGNTGSHQRSTFKKVVDLVLLMEYIMPIWKKARWEEQNVEFGTFELIGPDEVSTYRLLGEALPFLWQHDRLVDWLHDRV